MYIHIHIKLLSSCTHTQSHAYIHTHIHNNCSTDAVIVEKIVKQPLDNNLDHSQENNTSITVTFRTVNKNVTYRLAKVNLMFLCRHCFSLIPLFLFSVKPCWRAWRHFPLLLVFLCPNCISHLTGNHLMRNRPPPTSTCKTMTLLMCALLLDLCCAVRSRARDRDVYSY